MLNLPGKPESCWVAGLPDVAYPRLEGIHTSDVVVVGAGIAGLSTAMALAEAGRRVVVLESRRIGRQVTGRSSAKISSEHGLIYSGLIETSRDLAERYAAASKAGAARIKSWIETHRIACNWEPRSAYLYIDQPSRRSELELEADAAKSLGFDVRVHDRAPLPFPSAGALEFAGEAQFNPAKYLIGLAAAAAGKGASIFEDSAAQGFDQGGGGWRVSTSAAEVTAPHVVVATNLTVKSPIGFSGKTQPRCHIAMAFRLTDASAIEGMFLGLDEPTHSIRTGVDPGGPILLTLGPRFNTGHEADVAARFRDLEAWVRSRLPAGDALWRWCNEDYDTADRRPFVGQPDREKSPGFYVATGFNAWGITNGTAAGLSIASEIMSGTAPWGDVFDAARSAAKDFNIGGDTQSAIEDVAQLAPGEGGVIARGDQKIAVWRDDQGALHAVSAACTHKGCTVTWNNADRTWDCPCHGSIFEADGTVLHGPARTPLEKREI